MKKALIQLKILQIVGDAVLLLAAFALAYFLRVGWIFSSNFSFSEYAWMALLTMPITMVLMFFSRMYKLTESIISMRHLERIIFVCLENVAIFMVLYYFTYRIFFSRLILIYIFLLSTLFIYAWHLTFRKILQMSYQKEIGVYRTLILGTNRPAQEIIRQLITVKSHLKPVAILDAHGSVHKEIEGIPVLGKMDKFEKVIKEHKIDQIIQADHLEQTLNVINYALQNDLRYMMPPELLGSFQGHQAVEEYEGLPFLRIHKHKRWWHKIW